MVARLEAAGRTQARRRGDTYANIEALYGSAFGDMLIGDAWGGNVLAGLDGAATSFTASPATTSCWAVVALTPSPSTPLASAPTRCSTSPPRAAAGANHDYVDFRGIGAFSSFAITQVGADAHFVTNHGTVILQGITASTLVAGDFLF